MGGWEETGDLRCVRATDEDLKSMCLHLLVEAMEIDDVMMGPA